MRIRLLLLGTLILAASAINSLAGLGFIVAKTYDIYGNAEIKVITKDEYDALEKRFQLERILTTQAHRIAEDKWKKDNELRYKGREIGQRKITSLGSFDSMEKAQKKLENWQTRSSKDNKNSNNSKGNNNSQQGGLQGIVLRESSDTWQYPAKLPEAYDTSKQHGESGDRNRNKNNGDQQKGSAENRAKKLFILQCDWINRAKSVNLYIEALNELIKEKDAELGNDLALITNIPQMPKDPSADKDDGKDGKIGGKPTGSLVDKSSLSGGSKSILGKKIEME